MMEARAVEPDLEFVEEVRATGGADVEKCFQCGNCSVVCNLSPEAGAFPRKEMIWAQWGLRERLAADPDIWLCHQCNDCSLHCPRGARPGDVLAALRAAAIRYYAFPRFLAGWVQRPAALPLLFAVPVAIFLVMAFAKTGFMVPGGEVEYAKMFPLLWLEVLFFAVTGAVSLVFLLGVWRFIEDLPPLPPRGERLSLPRAVLVAVRTLLEHGQFATCSEPGYRYYGHVAVLLGFGALAFVGTVIGVGTMFFGLTTPLEFTGPLKLFANLSTIVILAGCAILVAGRLAESDRKPRPTYFDLQFLVVLGLVVLTGILTEVLRLAHAPAAAYPTYFVHLVLVFFLLAYAPYSKLAHVVYRTIAMVHAAASGRLVGSSDLPARE